MSSEARRDQSLHQLEEEFKEASRRWRHALQELEKLAAVEPPGDGDVEPFSVQEQIKVKEAAKAAEAHWRRILNDIFRLRSIENPAYQEAFARAERRLAEGPPWDDAFSPSELLNEQKESPPRL